MDPNIYEAKGLWGDDRHLNAVCPDCGAVYRIDGWGHVYMEEDFFIEADLSDFFLTSNGSIMAVLVCGRECNGELKIAEVSK